MRAKPNSNARSSKTSRANAKTNGVSKKIIKKGSKEPAKNTIPDLSVLRQPVDTSVCGLKQAVKVFETGTPEVLHLLTYDCDVVYECKVCRNLFRSIANFISHKRIYCTQRYSPAQDLRANKEGEFTLILGEKGQERFPTRITARKDLTSIVESLGGQNPARGLTLQSDDRGGTHNAEKKATTIHLEPMENTSYGVFQTVLKPESEHLMGNQVSELQKLLSQNEVILGPDGRILQNGLSDVRHEETAESESNTENNLVCSSCDVKFANRKTLTRHMRMMHETVRASYACPSCKNLFANPWSVYRHLYKVHKKTNEQVRRLRVQIRKKVEKPIANLAVNKKNTSPGKNKAESEHHNRLQQANKEWMDHFEEDWEFQRCGGCGRKFERKAALLSHAQICQKRILACNRIEQNYQGSITSISAPIPVVALTPLPCTKKPVPKPSPEKKIGIQVRMNYCKSGSQVSERQQACRSVLGDESDLEAVSVDGKDNSFQQTSLKEGFVLDQFFKNTNSCIASDGLDKVNSYLNNSTNRVDKMHIYGISTVKRPSIVRGNVGKSKSLEAKCLQLRSALENEGTEPVKNESKLKDDMSSYFDGNTDNTSESNISAVSSLSSQFMPVVDKGCVCEVEESIEINKIDISRSLDNIPSTEADSTSVSNGNGLYMTYDSHMYTGNVKYAPNCEVTCEEVSTSVITDEVSHSDSNLLVDSSCLQDDEISVDLKPIESPQDESKDSIKEIELENTISILTRNQLKAICKDDLVPDSQKVSQTSLMKKKSYDCEVESATKEITKKKLSKYIDDQNQCTVCLKKFKSLYKAYRHIITHTQWKRYECLYNGCTFQTFFKSTCLHHVTLHTRNSNDSSLSLVGIIDPSKWNLKIVKLKPIQSRTDNKIDRVIRKKDVVSKKLNQTLVSKKSVKTIASQKLAKTASKNLAKTLASKKLTKTVNRLPQNPSKSVKSKVNVHIVSKKPKISKLINRVSVKQKLLTDYKNFNMGAKINGKGILHNRKNKTKNEQTPKRKIPLNSSTPKKLKHSLVENANSVTEEAPVTTTGNTVIKKQKVSTSNLDESKAKVAVIKKERRDEIIINNISLDSNEPSIGKGRASRVSSRKSSVNSVDQPRGKSTVSTVLKVEDSSTFLNAPVDFESQHSIRIHNPEIVDGSSSLEEEESQESDRPVDVTHLNKLVMEVIFGPTPKPTQTTGRPVRNKSRPKRDNDFILGSQKEGEKDIIEAKSAVNKKATKALSSDCKPQIDTSKKSK